MVEAEPTQVAIAVVEHEGRFVIGQRPAGVPLAGYWEFPGGKVRPSEEPADAACRECLEETGLPVRAEELIATRTHRYDHGTVQLHFFRCETPSVDVVPRPPFRWVEREILREYRFPEGNRELIRQLSPDGTR